MKRSNRGRQVNETTPLTQAEEHDDVEDKIPWLQLFILCYARISDGWLFWTILPYVAQMVEDTGVAHDKIGFYSGLIESVYSVTEFLSMQFIWRHASDKYGRKPILILTMTGISASAIAFGYSKTVWQMLLSRAICGCFAGSIATIRIMFSEISTEKTRGTVFSYFAFTGSLSGLLSPLVGGLLARPADRFAYFRDWQSLIKYPYLLPSLVGGALPGSTAIIAVFLLDETKPEGADYSEAALSTKELLRVPGLLNLLVLHNWMSYVSFAWITIAPVFWYTKVERGGLGLAPHDIAWLMGTIGAFRGVMNIVSNPRLHKRYGTQGVLRLSTVGFLVTILLGPLTNLVRAHFTMPIVTGFLGFTVLSVYTQSLAYFAFSIATVDVSPSPQSLGQVVSFFLSNSVFIRAIAPATATSLYAYGVESQLASGQFAWIVLAFLAAGLCYQAFTTILYKAKKPTTPQAARHHAPRSMTSDEDA